MNKHAKMQAEIDALKEAVRLTEDQLDSARHAYRRFEQMYDQASAELELVTRERDALRKCLTSLFTIIESLCKRPF